MRQLIALYGTANVGKTASIRLLFEKLTARYPDYKFHNEVEPFIPGKDELGDIRVVIIINNKIIGIESQGDPNSRLFESLPLFADHDCEIIICATRTRGGTVWEVEKLHDEYNIKWIQKDNIENKNKRPVEIDKIADLLLKEIEMYL